MDRLHSRKRVELFDPRISGNLRPEKLLGDTEDRTADGAFRRKRLWIGGYQIGRASCRERVEISVGGVLLKKKKIALEFSVEQGARGDDRVRELEMLDSTR